jgi:hypothetical protein
MIIRRNTPARVVQRAALAFFVRTGYAAIHPPGRHHYGNQFPTLTVLLLPDTTWIMPQKIAMPNVGGGCFLARQPTIGSPASVKGFNRLRRRFAPLTGTNPRWSRAQMRKKTGGPPRHCTGRTGVTRILHLYTVRACALIVRRAVKARASRHRRALTARHERGHDVAHRARPHQREEPV